MPDPIGLKFARTHEWVHIDGDIATIGISDHAQEELGDVALILFPEVGQVFQVEEKFGEVESIKAVSDLYVPVSGEVIQVNEKLNVHPELVNDSPEDEGWMIRVKMRNVGDLDSLLTADEYEKHLQES